MATAERNVDIRAMGIGGATVLVSFMDLIELAYGIGILIGCGHSHNFAVCLDRPSPAVLVSEMGMACLDTKLSNYMTRDYSEFSATPPPPPPPVEYPF